MRLLYVNDNGVLSLTSDLQDDIPPYAILSHTWGDEQDEVTLDDVQNGMASGRKAFNKVAFCVNQARQDNLRYVWIDTCCIDKRNLVELSEAINSMFKWYTNANKCYVYLADVPNQQSDSSEHALENAFRRSRWFTRGWCLQELLAPVDVEFYTWQWQQYGTKRQHRRLIQSITGIDEHALLGAPLSSFSVERRFEWASRRQTKKPEDAIYCLLGIFGVSMPLNYAEGKEKARRRLNREIADNQQHLADFEHSTQQPVRRTTNYDAVVDGLSRMEQNHMDTGLTVMGFLQFSGMDARRINIESALEYTCEWILDHSAFRSWVSCEDQLKNALGEKTPILWIKGHPGAGKSTLIKYIDLNISQEIRNSGDLLISFYFTARGNDLERSVAGMYRTLIVQLCTLVPDLTKVLGEMKSQEKMIYLSEEELLQSLTALKEIFKELVSRVPRSRLYCLIDALDETNEDDVVAMTKFIRAVERSAAKQNVRMLICLASRHYPTVVVPGSLPVILDGEAGHRQDLRIYVDSSLQISNSDRAEPIKDEILAKANGIFMWVVLVVEILNKEYRRGNIMMVEKKLRHIPTELSALFSEILQQGDNEPEAFLWCLELILFAREPLNLLQFYHAVLWKQLGSEGYLRRHTDMEPTTQEMQNFLVTNTKGLAEAVERKKSVHTFVQFIHKSVPDFLLEYNGLDTVRKLCKSPAVLSAHEQIKGCCIQALELKTPLSPYACRYFFYHADKAAEEGVRQDDFCQLVTDEHVTATWQGLHESSLPEHLLTHTLIWGYRNLTDCVLGHDSICSQAALDDALLLSARTMKPDILRRLLKAGANVNAQDKNGCTALLHVMATLLRGEDNYFANEVVVPYAWRNYNRGVVPTKDGTSEQVYDILIGHEADVNISNYAMETPLHLAVALKTPIWTQKLLRAGADPNTSDEKARTAYSIASHWSHTSYLDTSTAQPQKFISGLLRPIRAKGEGR